MPVQRRWQLLQHVRPGLLHHERLARPPVPHQQAGVFQQQQAAIDAAGAAWVDAMLLLGAALELATALLVLGAVAGPLGGDGRSEGRGHIHMAQAPGGADQQGAALQQHHQQQQKRVPQ